MCVMMCEIFSYIPIIAFYLETNLRCVESQIRIISIMSRMRLIVIMSVSLKMDSTWTHITFLCVLTVLLLLFINFDLRLQLIVDGNTVYVTSLQLSCKCLIESCNCL